MRFRYIDTVHTVVRGTTILQDKASRGLRDGQPSAEALVVW